MFCFNRWEKFYHTTYGKDYKRIGEGDTGLNTGGMGAVSPVPFVDSVFENKILNKVIKPTIDGMKRQYYLQRIYFYWINKSW